MPTMSRLRAVVETDSPREQVENAGRDGSSKIRGHCAQEQGASVGSSADDAA